MLNKSIFSLVLLMLTLSLQAQDGDTDRKWVTDKLRLSLYREADAQSQVLQYLSSGDVLEIEQLSGAFGSDHIRTGRTPAATRTAPSTSNQIGCQSTRSEATTSKPSMPGP